MDAEYAEKRGQNSIFLCGHPRSPRPTRMGALFIFFRRDAGAPSALSLKDLPGFGFNRSHRVARVHNAIRTFGQLLVIDGCVVGGNENHIIAAQDFGAP